MKIKNLGVVPGLSAAEKKSVMLVNMMTVCMVFLSVFSAVMAFAWGTQKAWAILTFPFIWFIVFNLNHRRLYHIASSVFCLGGLITAAGLAVVFDHHQFYFWLIPLSLSPFLIFSSEYRQWGNVFSGGIWLAFAIVLYLATKDAFSIVISMASLLMLSLGIYARNIALISEFQLKEERGHSEQLLLNFIPKKFVRKLMSLGGEAPMIAQRYEDVIVLFADIVNFTPMSEELPPEQLVQVLNELFTEFDILIAKYGLEKIKTIGDAYMIGAGVPEPMESPEIAVADFALEMRGAVQKVDLKWKRDLDIRIGIHSGPVVAGVIGIQKYAFDLWGDTVNIAARMESHGLPGQIHLSEVMADKLKKDYILAQRGWVDVKGKGMMQTFWLKGKETEPQKRVQKRMLVPESSGRSDIYQTTPPKASTAKAFAKKEADALHKESKRNSMKDSKKNSRKDSKNPSISDVDSSSKESQSNPDLTDAVTSKSLPPRSGSAKKASRTSGTRSGAFRKTLSPDETRSDLFQKSSPRAGASSLSGKTSNSGSRSNVFRKTLSPDDSNQDETLPKSENSKDRKASAFRRSKK